MPCFLRRRALVATLAFGATIASGSVARASDHDAPPPRFTVTPALAMPSEVTTTLDVPKANSDAVALESTSESTPDRIFYGWQNIVAGYAGIGMMAAGVKEGGALPFVGLGVYALGGPIVHIAHKEYARAAGSLVINVLTPVLVGALAHSMDKPCAHNEEEGCSLDTVGYAITGVVVGMLVAPIIDGVTMGWEDAPRKPAPDIAIQPTVSIARKEPNGASTTTFGVAGVF